jgi:TM2 domain-containing membrane protein YozV|tara:strand:- start:99 stop:440 length:342 start_codon:yes stop_codon:yes gene_type:complete
MQLFPKADPQEQLFLNGLVKEMSEDALSTFAVTYNAQRKDSTTVLILTLLAGLGIAGVNRFYLGQIGMGVLFLLTGGFCFVGSLIDLFRHKTLTSQVNQQKALELAMLVKGAT